MSQYIHGTAWTDHALHYCTHGPFVAARQAVQDALSGKLSFEDVEGIYKEAVRMYMDIWC